MNEDLHDLHDLHELRALLGEQRIAMAALADRVRELETVIANDDTIHTIDASRRSRARATPDDLVDQIDIAVAAHATDIETDRRGLLRGLTLGAAGAVAFAGTSALNTSPAAAAPGVFDGNPAVTATALPISGIGVLGTTGSGAGLKGSASGLEGDGVFGESTWLAGTGSGVEGRSAGNQGRGVYGVTTSATSAEASGVRGECVSPFANGVEGVCLADTGTGKGVRGATPSPNGVGVFGTNLAVTGTSAGVMGQGVSPTGYGVVGTNTAATSGVGVRGTASSSTGIGVLGAPSDNVGATVGVVGESISALGIGTLGHAKFFGIGVVGDSARSQLQLRRTQAPAPPLAAGLARLAGEIAFDQNGDLWLCVADGTPGSWHRLGGTNTAGVLTVLPATKRVYDSRIGEPPLFVPPKVPMTANETRTLDMKQNSSTVPAGARAVLLNLTVANTSPAGFVGLFKGDISWPGNSSINWDHAGQAIANLAVVALDASANIKAYNGGAQTDIIIDVIGYFL